MKIAQFHYHLQPGGVTDVIILSAKTLLRRRDDITELRLVTGRREGAEETCDRIRRDLPREKADALRLDFIEEIDYEENLSERTDSGALVERLEARYGDDTIWWIHNYQIGKNPAFTAALMMVAEKGNRNIIFQIHDFPECARFENLARLDAVLDGPPYPSGPRIRYAVINERDRKLLVDAGIDDGAVFRLDNPVPLSPMETFDVEETKSALDEVGKKEFPAWTPGAPVVFYPVRTIRRKNVLEAALMIRLVAREANLVVSLPGTSGAERPYSDRVEKAFREGLAPGIWGTGTSDDPRLDYPRMIAACDGVISSSVQEGFGYLFINALHWRKPLLARYLDVMDGFLDIFRDYPRRFWADFRIPAWAGLREKTIESYKGKVAALAALLPARSVKSLTMASERIAQGGGIDISFVSVEDQLEALRRARDDEEWTSNARQLNKELLDAADLTLSARAPDIDVEIEGQFGEAAYARGFEGIRRSFGEAVKTPDPAAIRNSLLKAFSRLDYFRLLYDS